MPLHAKMEPYSLLYGGRKQNAYCRKPNAADNNRYPNLILIVGWFDHLTSLTKYSLLAAPRPHSPISLAEHPDPLGRQVSGDGVLIQTYSGLPTAAAARTTAI